MKICHAAAPPKIWYLRSLICLKLWHPGNLESHQESQTIVDISCPLGGALEIRHHTLGLRVPDSVTERSKGLFSGPLAEHWKSPLA